jgi:hypothetical protein
VVPTPTLPETANPFDGAAVLDEYPIAELPLTCSLLPTVEVPMPTDPVREVVDVLSLPVHTLSAITVPIPMARHTATVATALLTRT